MSEDLREIATMIATASAGDGDRVLDILEKIYGELSELERRVRKIEESK